MGDKSAAEQNGTASGVNAPHSERVDLHALLADSKITEVLDELDHELVGLKPVKARVREIKWV